MSRVEFAQELAFLADGCNCREVSRETAEVYFELLGDLPLAALKVAVRRALLESCRALTRIIDSLESVRRS